MIGCGKNFESNNKTMSFKFIDKKLLKTNTKIWEKISSLVNEEIYSEPLFGDNDKYIKIKIRSYGDKTNISCQSKKVPKENTSYKYLSLIMSDSVAKVNKKYYPQTLSEECKYEIKNNIMGNLINDHLDPSSSDNESENESEESND